MHEPTTIRVQRREMDAVAYVAAHKAQDGYRYAEETDYSRLTTEPTIVMDAKSDQVVLVYLAPIAEDTRVLVAVLRHIDIPWGERLSGIDTQWRSFGPLPRNERWGRDSCRPSDLAVEEPTEHEVISSYAPVIAGYYARYGPATYDIHARKVRQVRAAWTLKGGPFTGGIVNRDGDLPYHNDKTNFKDVWSGMLGFKQGVTGGYLSVPEYDLAVEVADQSLTLFDGQDLLHGVTPFAIAPGGYRLTAVYYSRAGMAKCLAPGEEVKRRR